MTEISRIGFHFISRAIYALLLVAMDTTQTTNISKCVPFLIPDSQNAKIYRYYKYQFWNKKPVHFQYTLCVEQQRVSKKEVLSQNSTIKCKWLEVVKYAPTPTTKKN